LKNTLILLILIVLAPLNLTAQPPDPNWRLFDDGHTEYEHFNDVYARADGGYYVCGTSGYEHQWLISLNAAGEERWRFLGDSGVFTSVIEADNGDAVCGEAHGNREFGVSRVSSRGALVWRRSFGHGECWPVIELKEGDFIAAGQINRRGVVVRLNDGGDLIWIRQFGDSVNIPIFFSCREAEGGVVLAGRNGRMVEIGGRELNVSIAWLLKINFNGDVIWDRRFEGDDEQASSFMSIISIPSGYAMVGRDHDFNLTIINSQGQLIRRAEYGEGYARGIAQFSDGGFILTGLAHGYPLAIRTDEIGQEIWRTNFSDRWGEIGQVVIYNALRSVLVLEGDQIVMVGGFPNPAPQRGRDALLMFYESGNLAPQIFYHIPEDTILTRLPGDSVRFIVRARTREGEELHYSWHFNGRGAGNDTTVYIGFPAGGDSVVTCTASAQFWAAQVKWLVRLRELFIASHTPDTLSLTIRRGSTVEFGLDSVAALDEEGLNYEWTLTDLYNFERENAGSETHATIEFLRSGGFQLQGAVYRGDLSDNVVWDIAVRSAILDFWPRELNLSVPPDSSGEFGVIPFNPESDSLSYRWEVDGDSVGSDSTVSLRFAWDDWRIGNPPHLVCAIVMDGMEGDTITWEVTVREPEEVGKWSDGQVEKWGLLSVSPNPFNSTTTIRYSTSGDASPTRLTVHDLTGREVVRLVDSRAQQSPPSRGGPYAVSWDASELPAGIYLLKLEAGGKAYVMKSVIVK